MRESPASAQTLYGFFPSPPKVSIFSVVNHFKDLSLFSSLGLREMDGTPKPALEVWMGFRK